MRTIGTAAATLTYGVDGSISSVTTYVDNDYTATGGSNVKTDASVFGFDSNYMALISWSASGGVPETTTGLVGNSYYSNC